MSIVIQVLTLNSALRGAEGEITDNGVERLSGHVSYPNEGFLHQADRTMLRSGNVMFSGNVEIAGVTAIFLSGIGLASSLLLTQR